MQFTIAVVQFAIQPYQPEKNLARAEQFIKEAATHAQLVVFPEDFVTGPLLGDISYADAARRYLQHFQRLAQRYAIDIVPGSLIEFGADHKVYNTTYYLDRSGEVLGRYCKVNLWHPERAYMQPGSAFPVFSTRHGRVGLIICWDLIFPEVFRAMVRQDVELVICPSYWCFEDAGIGLRHDGYSEVKLVDALCVARAFEHEIALVFANAATTGSEGVEQPIGRSQVTVPFKGALHALHHTHEEIFFQQIDTAILKDAEQVYTIRKDLQAQQGNDLTV